MASWMGGRPDREEPSGRREDSNNNESNDSCSTRNGRDAEAEFVAAVRRDLRRRPKRLHLEGLPPGLAFASYPEAPTERAAHVRDQRRSLDNMYAQVTARHELFRLRAAAFEFTSWKWPGAQAGKPDAKKATTGERVVSTFDEFAKMLVPTIEVAGPINPARKPTALLGCFSPAMFVGLHDDGARGGAPKKNNASCVLMSACMLDLEGDYNPRIIDRDGEYPFEVGDGRVLPFPFPWGAIAFDTPSSTWARPRQRIVLPYLRLCAPDEHVRIAKHLARQLALHAVTCDSTHDPCRGWFYGVRARMPDGTLAPFELLNLDGELLDPDVILAEIDDAELSHPQSEPSRRSRTAPEPFGQVQESTHPPESSLPPITDRLERARAHLTTCPPSIAGHGGKRALFNAVLYIVRGLVLTGNVAVDLLAEHFNPRCVYPSGASWPWSFAELRAKVDEVARVGRKQWGFALADCAVVWPGLRDHVLGQLDALQAAGKIHGTAGDSIARGCRVVAEVAFTHGREFALSSRQLAEAAGIAQSTAVRVLDRMAALGLVQLLARPRGRNGHATRLRVLGPESACVPVAGCAADESTNAESSDTTSGCATGSVRTGSATVAPLSGTESAAHPPVSSWRRRSVLRSRDPREVRLPGDQYSALGKLELAVLGNPAFRMFYAILAHGPRSQTAYVKKLRVGSATLVREGLARLRELGLIDAKNALVPNAAARLVELRGELRLDLADATQVARHNCERHYMLDEPAWLDLAALMHAEIARDPGKMRDLTQRTKLIRIVQRAGCRSWSRGRGDDGRQFLAVVDDKRARGVIHALQRFLLRAGAIEKRNGAWHAVKRPDATPTPTSRSDELREAADREPESDFFGDATTPDWEPSE